MFSLNSVTTNICHQKSANLLPLVMPLQHQQDTSDIDFVPKFLKCTSQIDVYIFEQLSSFSCCYAMFGPVTSSASAASLLIRLFPKRGNHEESLLFPLADLRGTQILSISCSFRENLAKSYVVPLGELAPPAGEIQDPPLIPT